jgi:hypothetical protein
MRQRPWPALIVVLIGLGYIFIPRYVFPICEFADIQMAAEAPQPMGGAAMGGSAMESHGHAPIAAMPEPAMAAAGHASAGEGGHMVCWYTWKAEIGTGIAVIIGGLLLLVSGAGTRRGVFLMLAALGLVGGLFPTALIGVCPGASMPCRTGTLPALVILSAFLAVLSLIWARMDKPKAP